MVNNRDCLFSWRCIDSGKDETKNTGMQDIMGSTSAKNVGRAASRCEQCASTNISRPRSTKRLKRLQMSCSAGGTHHAFAYRGEGFCVFNDIAVSARMAMTEEGIEKVLVIDLDVHQVRMNA